MKRRLVIRPEAQLDLDEAAFWYDDQKPGLGELLTEELAILLERITDHPLQFPQIGQDVHRGLLHRFPYAVYFLLADESVVILALLHQHRNPGIWKARL
jgi:plasmid stabilization system protein ParE